MPIFVPMIGESLITNQYACIGQQLAGNSKSRRKVFVQKRLLLQYMANGFATTKDGCCIARQLLRFARYCSHPFKIIHIWTRWT